MCMICHADCSNPASTSAYLALYSMDLTDLMRYYHVRDTDEPVSGPSPA